MSQNARATLVSQYNQVLTQINTTAQDASFNGINLLNGDTENISHLHNRDFSFIKHDVTNYIYIDGPVDYVLH